VNRISARAGIARKAFFMAVLMTLFATSVWAFQTETSYYTRASCLAESGQCTMANGKELVDENFTAAMWGVPLGSRYRVTRLDRPDLSTTITITDRGPAKRLVAKGRRLDVSLATAKALGMVKKGVCKVEVEKIK
jgi:rare lipoprotein A